MKNQDWKAFLLNEIIFWLINGYERLDHFGVIFI